MYWTERIQNIYSFLNKNGYKQKIEEMIDDYGIGGTPGEQFSIVCTWLAKMRNHEKELYDLIKEDGDAILQEGIDVNYFTAAYYRSL